MTHELVIGTNDIQPTAAMVEPATSGLIDNAVDGLEGVFGVLTQQQLFLCGSCCVLYGMLVRHSWDYS